MNFLQSVFTFIVVSLLLFSSCKKDEPIVIKDQDLSFVIKTTAPDLIIITKNDGTVLFESTDVNKGDSIALNVKQDQLVNFTYGYFNVISGGFRLYTYRNVKGDFKFERIINECDFEYTGYGATETYQINFKKSVDEKIDFNDMYAPSINGLNIDVDSNFVTIRGHYYLNRDFSFCYKNLDGKIKCIDLQSNFWDADSSIEIDSMDMRIGNENVIAFRGAVPSTIKLVAKDSVSDYSFILVDDNFNKFYNPADSLFTFYSPSSIGVDSLYFSMEENNWTYNGVFKSFPEDVNLEAPKLKITASTNNSFSFEVEGKHDLDQIEYKYPGNSSWEVYQTQYTSKSFELPPIPNEFFNGNEDVILTLQNPNKIIVTTYLTDESDIYFDFNHRKLDFDCYNVIQTSVYKTF